MSDARPTTFFGRLPLGAKVLFILVWPVSLAYGVYRMWATKAFNHSTRVVLTAVAAVFTIAVFATSNAATDTSSEALTDSQSTRPQAEQVPASPTPTREVASTSITEPATDPEPPVVTSTVVVTRIVDGDTIEVRMPDGATEKIRFIGVDTPESTNEIEQYGKEASAYTTAQLEGRTLYLETDVEQRDKYGRLLAHVWLAVPEAITDAEIREHLFNARLLLDGYANLMTIPPNVKYVDFLETYETEARNASIGLWAASATPAVPPVTVAPTPAPAPQPSSTGGAYVANRNTKKFHYASCSSVDEMNPENKVPYASREAAAADGYVPCGRCNP